MSRQMLPTLKSKGIGVAHQKQQLRAEVPIPLTFFSDFFHSKYDPPYAAFPGQN